LQKLCSKAEYCRADVYRKALKDLEGDAEAAGKVVGQLVADKYVDDARYASAYAREKAGLQGWGPVKIRFQLRAKGVSDADIASALQEIEPEKADARLEKLLAAKARTLEGDPQFRLKLLKFALSRGYEYDTVEAALKKI
jgi:regulatory protein